MQETLRALASPWLLGVLLLAWGCRIEPVPGRTADAPTTARGEDSAGFANDTLVMLSAPGLPDAADRALALCRVLQGGMTVDIAVATAMEELECEARALGRVPREVLMASADGRWGAAATAKPRLDAAPLSAAALDMWSLQSGLRIVDADSGSSAGCSPPAAEVPSVPASPAAPVAPLAALFAPGPSSVAASPQADSVVEDQDAGTEAEPVEVESAGAAPVAPVTPAPFGLLLRVSRVDLRGALIAFDDGTGNAPIRDAVPGERLYVGPRGGVLRTASGLPAAAASQDYATLSRPLAGSLPADALFVTAQSAASAGPWVVAHAAAGVHSMCTLIAVEAAP